MHAQFVGAMQDELREFAARHASFVEPSLRPGVRLIDFDIDSVARVAGALLFGSTSLGLAELQQYCKTLPDEELARILDAAASSRENRRHKSPRALEHAGMTFEIVADFGVYRDLHRHRILTQERQLLGCDLGYYIPAEIIGTEMEREYCDAMEMAKKAFHTMASEFPEEAQYVVPMAFNIRWYFHINLRSLQWLCELRSQASGHPTYRFIAQEMARQVSVALPAFERFFKFVDYNGYELGRLGAEIRQEQRLQSKS